MLVVEYNQAADQNRKLPVWMDVHVRNAVCDMTTDNPNDQVNGILLKVPLW